MLCGCSAGAAVASVAAVGVGVLSAGCQGQRQRGSDSKIFLHEVSSPYCVFSAAKVCGVMLAAESVTLYPLAFATA